VLRIALPRSDVFEVQQSRPDARVQGRALQPFGVGQASRIDGRQTTREAPEVADLTVNCLTPPVFEQIVVQVDAVEVALVGWAS
jgi:hypothetical protein